jgi:para-aminobenzoate synthetase/4-amino-4-deoxychorismate lyase
LQDSAGYFGFDVPMAEIKSRLETAQAGFQSGRWKIRLLVAGNGDIAIESAPLTGILGARIGISRVPINTRTPFVYHKTTYRRVYDEILSGKREGEDDLVFWNEEGLVTETGIANVVIDDGSGSLITPPVDCGLLAGVQRSWLLKQNIIREGAITLNGLRNAKAVYLINSVRGWLVLKRETDNSWVVSGEQFPGLAASYETARTF